MTLLGKVLPLQVTGTAEAPITIKLMKYDGAVADDDHWRRPIIDAEPIEQLPVPRLVPTDGSRVNNAPAEHLPRDPWRPALSTSEPDEGGSAGEAFRIFRG